MKRKKKCLLYTYNTNICVMVHQKISKNVICIIEKEFKTLRILITIFYAFKILKYFLGHHQYLFVSTYIYV